jgi:hypothetical protein
MENNIAASACKSSLTCDSLKCYKFYWQGPCGSALSDTVAGSIIRESMRTVWAHCFGSAKSGPPFPLSFLWKRSMDGPGVKAPEAFIGLLEGCNFFGKLIAQLDILVS